MKYEMLEGLSCFIQVNTKGKIAFYQFCLKMVPKIFWQIRRDNVLLGVENFSFLLILRPKMDNICAFSLKLYQNIGIFVFSNLWRQRVFLGE